MKLYIVGAHSPHPDDWRENWALVLAETPEQALGVAGDLVGPPVLEVDVSRPALLCHQPLVILD